MALLEVKGLRKKYPGFLLDDVSFKLEKGRVMGLIGRNGAGKTTTLRSIFGLVRPDAGSIDLLGTGRSALDPDVRKRIGFAGGAVDYFKRKKIKDISSVTRAFYDNWDEGAYRKYMSAFSLDGEKTPLQLSEGMRVKYSLTLSLSHRAELLILDEPTAGLDPVSRAELLETFLYLKEQGVGVLFSSHITTDLEKCADDITYLAKGKLIASKPLGEFLSESALSSRGSSLEEIMVSYEKESIHEKLAE